MQGARFSFVSDSIVSDFLSGEVEHATWSAWDHSNPEVIVLEETGNVAYVAPAPQQSTPSPVAVPESTDPDISIADVPTEAIWE